MKIIASDFDNTLFVEDKNIVEKNVKSINNFIKKGNIFIVITGRMYTNIKQELDKYDIKYSYLICEDGTKIFNNLDYSIKDYLLSTEKIEKIEEILKEHNLNYFLDDGYNITNNKNDCIKINSKITDRDLYIKLLDEIKSEVDVYAYLSREYLNITDSEASKSIALKYLMENEKYDLNDLYVIGDDVNDIEMIKDFNGYTMTNHTDLLDGVGKKEFTTLFDFIDYVEKI